MGVTFFRKKVIIGCFIVFVTLLAGCGMQKSNEEYFQKYETRQLDTSDLGDGLINILSVQNGDIYFSFHSYADKTKMPLYHMDADGLQPERMPLDHVIKDTYIWDVSYPSDGKRYIVSRAQDRIAHLNELDEKNQLVAQIDLEAIIPDCLKSPYTFKTDKRGLLYLVP